MQVRFVKIASLAVAFTLAITLMAKTVPAQAQTVASAQQSVTEVRSPVGEVVDMKPNGPISAPELNPLPMDVPYAAHGYKVKLGYQKYCFKSGLQLTLDVSGANADGAVEDTLLCSGTMRWKIKYGDHSVTVKVYFMFTRGNNWSRISLLLHVLTADVKKGNWGVSFNRAGYVRPSGASYYSSDVYHWFRDRAASKLFVVADFFRVHYKDDKVWTQEHFQRSMPVNVR